MGGVLENNPRISSSANSTYFDAFTGGSLDQLSSFQRHIPINKWTGTGALYLGYGRFINNTSLFVAAEIAGSLAQHKTTLHNFANHQFTSAFQDSLATSSTVTLNSGEFDFDLRPGFLMDTRTMLYGRVGGALNQLTLNTKNNFSFTTPPTTYDSPLSQHKNKNVVGIRLGAGIERSVKQNLSITADYIYTYYGKVSTSGVANTQDPVVVTNGLIGRSSASLFTQAAMLGVKYYFPVK